MAYNDVFMIQTLNLPGKFVYPNEAKASELENMFSSALVPLGELFLTSYIHAYFIIVYIFYKR